MRRTAPLIIFVMLFATVVPHLSAEISFGGLNINSNNDLLFSAYQNIPGTQPYTSLLLAHLNKKGVDGVPTMLTCFPERMELLKEGRTLQIRNRYGTAWYTDGVRTLSWITAANRIPVEYTRMGPESASPDGKWLCFVRQTKSSLGQLVLQNVNTLEEEVLVESTPFSYETVNVKWAPDSSAVLYEKNGLLYFSTPGAVFKKVQLPEEYRKIGPGTIQSVCWTDEKSFVYIDGDIIYLMQENELYTRGLYSALVGSGTITGRLPAPFDSYHDRFWCDSDGSQLVVISSDKMVSYYSVPIQKFDYVHINGIFPLTGIEGSLLSYNIFWTTESKPVLWIDMLRYDTGRKASSVYTLAGKMELVLTVKGSIKPQLSRDTRHVAFTGGTSLYVYDTTTWKQTARLNGEKVISFVWNDKQSLYVGGTQTIRLWKFDARSATAASLPNEETPSAPGESRVLLLSSVSSAYWSDTTIIARPAESGTVYSYDSSRNGWNALPAAPEVKDRSVEQNGRFRVFTGTAQNKRYTNAIFVRSLSGAVLTYPLYADTDMVVEEPKKAAIVFDAMDSVEGLAPILYVLDEYNIKGTFFINGEFIRRYPTELKQIISAGHECASLFYTTADLTEKNFVIDADFVKRGLARNEDEFYSATGKELALLWHAPYYHETELIKSAGKSAGYRYIKAFTAYSDRVTLELSERNPAYLYLDAGRLIDAFVSSLQDGMIIPVTTGNVNGTRKDYLYEKTDLLISALLNAGYTLVDVRSITQ